MWSPHIKCTRNATPSKGAYLNRTLCSCSNLHHVGAAFVIASSNVFDGVRPPRPLDPILQDQQQKETELNCALRKWRGILLCAQRVRLNGNIGASDVRCGAGKACGERFDRQGTHQRGKAWIYLHPVLPPVKYQEGQRNSLHERDRQTAVSTGR